MGINNRNTGLLGFSSSHDYFRLPSYSNLRHHFHSRAVLESDNSALLQSVINMDHVKNVVIEYYQLLPTIRSHENRHTLERCAHKYNHMGGRSVQLHAALPTTHHPSRRDRPAVHRSGNENRPTSRNYNTHLLYHHREWVQLNKQVMHIYGHHQQLGIRPSDFDLHQVRTHSHLHHDRQEPGGCVLANANP